MVCGVRNEKVQQRLLSEKGLTLERALEVATSMEAAAKYTKDISRGNEESTMPVHKFERRECYQCGNTTHLGDSCMFKDKKEFFFCNFHIFKNP